MPFVEGADVNGTASRDLTDLRLEEKERSKLAFIDTASSHTSDIPSGACALRIDMCLSLDRDVIIGSAGYVSAAFDLEVLRARGIRLCPPCRVFLNLTAAYAPASRAASSGFASRCGACQRGGASWAAAARQRA
eukprot:43906-Pleurochrysis_carterae.AAC.2